MSFDASSANRRLRRYQRRFRILKYAFFIVFTAGAVALSIGYAKADSNAAAFAAAAACSGSGRSGCTGQVPVALVDAGITSGKSASHWLEVVGDSVADQRVTLSCGNSEPAFFMAAQGKGLLTATVWQGRVASLSYNVTDTCDAANTPTDVATFWLVGLGIVGTLLLGSVAVLARSRIRDRRRRQIAAVAIAPFYMNVLIFPITLGATGKHALWLYLPAYAIGAAIELPLIGLGAYRRRRREARELTHPPASARGAHQTKSTNKRADKHTGRNVGFVFFGLLAAGALTLLGFYIPAQANAFAYENAAPCKGSATAGCVQQVQATIVDTGSYAQGSTSRTYWIEITGPGIPAQQFNLGGGDPAGLMSAAQSAGTITARLWQGRVVEVEDAGTTSPGPSTPNKTAAELLAGLYPLLAAIVFWLLAIAAAKAGPTRRRHVYLAAGIVLLAGGVFSFAPLLVQAKPVLWAYPLTCAIAAVVVLPLYWFVLVMTRRAERRRAAALGR